MGRPPCRQSGKFTPDGVTPLCQHEEPMYRIEGKRPGWKCAVRARERSREFMRNHDPEKKRKASLKYQRNNRDKIQRANDRRIFIGNMYCGMVGFTDKERKAILDGTTD